MVIHLIHGIHTQGDTPVEGLITYMKDFETRYPDYGFILGVETRIVNPIIVGSLLPYIAPEDIVIGHSNGCAIAYDLMNRGVEMAGAVFINAALEQDIIRPKTIPWIDIYYNQGDEITEAAKLGAKLGVTDIVWGEMGHAGYLGNDPEITSYNCGATGGMPIVSGHSDFFTPTKLASWGPFVYAKIQAHLSQASS
jgi:hypothetical protein